MATSGSSDFTRTRNQICRAAARKINAISAGATMSDQMLTDFVEALNAMVKHWQGKGLHVWTVAEATLFLQKSQRQYILGATDHATESYVETELDASASSGASTITVDSSSGLAASQNIGIELDDGSMYWTTISGTPTTTVTLAAVMSGAAAVGNRVIAYTTRILRPLKIVQMRRYHHDDASDIEITLAARLDYQRLPNKTTAGIVYQAFYDPRGGANATGLLSTYHVPQNVDDALKFTWWRPIQDFDNPGDNPDLPQEWIRTLVWNLALEMGPEFRLPRDELQTIAEFAAASLDDMTGWDREEESVRFELDMSY